MGFGFKKKVVYTEEQIKAWVNDQRESGKKRNSKGEPLQYDDLVSVEEEYLEKNSNGGLSSCQWLNHDKHLFGKLGHNFDEKNGDPRMDVNTKHENRRFFQITRFIIIRIIMVNYYPGMKSKHVMGLYGDTERHISRRMKINVRMLGHQPRNVNLNKDQVKAIMLFLHEGIVQYVEEMVRFSRYVSTNATTYPRKT